MCLALSPGPAPFLIGRGLGTRLACATQGLGALKLNCKSMKTLVESKIGMVPMAMSPWPWPRSISHMRGAWGLGNKSRPRLLPRTFLVLTSGVGGGASKSSFLIQKQPAVATKFEIFKLEIFKLEMFGLEMVGWEMSDLNGSCRPP